MTLDLTIAQFCPSKGDLEATIDSFGAAVARSVDAARRPDLVLFPETALTGYFLEGAVRDLALPAEEALDRVSSAFRERADGSVDVVFGFYELDSGRVYNAAMYARVGETTELVHVHRKVFLPTYGVFQEERFVESGTGVAAFDTAWGRAALLICEDAWHSISGVLAALDGAQVILVPSASPARGATPGSGVPDNLARWDLLGSSIAAEHGVFVVVSQLVGFEGGKGFAGGSAAYSPRGERMVAGPLWEETLLTLAIDPSDIVQARTEEPLLADLERSWTRLLVNSPGARVRRPEAEPG